MNLIVFSGSYRPERRSHQVALEVKNRLEGRGHTVTLLDVRELDFPLLENTYRETENPPEKMKKTSESIAGSAGLVLVSPEHNNSYSGALKNAMDYFFPEYKHKVFGIVAVSNGAMGGINAAKRLQDYALTLKGIVQPNFMLTGKVQNVFENGKLVDEAYGERLNTFLDEFLWLAEIFKNAPPQPKKAG